jgi:hypothetical protein
MYLSGSQVRRERTIHHASSTKEGPSLSRKRKKKKKGASTVDRKKERLSDERKKVPLDEMKKWGAPIWKERRTYATVACAHPRSSFKVTYIRQQPMVSRGTTSSLEELDLRIRKWRTQTLREVNNRAKFRSHRINKAEFDHRECGVRGSDG